LPPAQVIPAPLWLAGTGARPTELFSGKICLQTHLRQQKAIFVVWRGL